ncbi:unnamed protein product [Parnassius mnemosyne]|uniref:DUF4708 domain-containing protein n=1 Tax=Parnassius mnemosyne TaxID=213953 RepID=A0AAV1MBH0_9NEOP
MQSFHKFYIENPNFNNIGHVVATANLSDKHDRSAPSDYHWKILKCRMIIFSNSSFLACPDKKEVKQVHIIINTLSDDYDRLTSLFLKFCLKQEGSIRKVTPETFLMCYQYTLIARVAPIWNTLGYDYLINNRDFLTAFGPQEGIKYNISINDSSTVLELKPVKITLMKSDNKYKPSDCVRVLPSLNKAVVEEYYETLPESGNFRCYKDLRRHWKNIHGYRLPEEEYAYYAVRFWRGEPLTYPKICLTSNFPIITPLPKSTEATVLARFLNCLKSKMSQFLGIPLTLINQERDFNGYEDMNETYKETQTVSLCTPTQQSTPRRLR